MRVLYGVLKTMSWIAFVPFWIYSFAVGNGWLILLAAVGAVGVYIWLVAPHSLRLPYEANNSIESARNQMARLCDSAKSEVNIVSGSLKAAVYEVPPVNKAIERAIERGVAINAVVVGERLDERFSGEGHWTRHRAVSLRHLPIECSHMMIVDGWHIRIEKKHGQERDDRKAVCRYFGRELAGEGNNSFWRMFEKGVAGAA